MRPNKVTTDWRARSRLGTVQSHSVVAETVPAEAVGSVQSVDLSKLYQLGEDVGNCIVQAPEVGVSQLLAEFGGTVEVQHRLNWCQTLQSMGVEVPQRQ